MVIRKFSAEDNKKLLQRFTFPKIKTQHPDISRKLEIFSFKKYNSKL